MSSGTDTIELEGQNASRSNVSGAAIVSSGAVSNGIQLQKLPLTGEVANGVDKTNTDVATTPITSTIMGKVTPVEISFHNIQYSVPAVASDRSRNQRKGSPAAEPATTDGSVQMTNGKPMKMILKGISGVCAPGKVTAIMGPSGSGKTTLLNVLAGKVPIRDQVTGAVKANDERFTPDFNKKQAGYVRQDDLLFTNQTVYEAIKFSALLRMPRSITFEEKETRIEEVIDVLGLRKARNTKIGNEFVRGISGGERKRVCIGQELVRKISVLYLDEPTSGLDSFIAYNVMKLLKSLARDLGMTIICTIHQPRSQIWDLFDDLILLSEGNVMYSGPADQSLAYFKALGYPCPEHYNPADYFLDLVAIDYRTKVSEDETKRRVNSLAEAFKREESSGKVGNKRQSVYGGMKTLAGTEQPTSSRILQFALLFRRSILELLRSRMTTFVKLFQTLFFACLAGGIFYQIGLAQISVQDRAGSLFFVLMNQGMNPMFAVLNAFPAEKAVFKRENESGYYGTLAYYLAKSFAEIPYAMPFTLLFSAIVYNMVGYQASAATFFTFWFTLQMVQWSTEGMALMIGAIVPNFQMAMLLAPLFLIIFILCAGLYVNIDTIPLAIRWVSDISFMRYGYRALMVNEFTGLVFTCSPQQLVTTASGITQCPVATGEQALELYTMTGSTVLTDISYLFYFALVTRVLAFFFLLLNRPRYKVI